jgi:transcription elongation factor Elf1
MADNGIEKMVQNNEQGGDFPINKANTTLKEVQQGLSLALANQFNKYKTQLTCPMCDTKGGMVNHGTGGGVLQHGTKSIQLKCKACEKKSRPGTTYAKSGLQTESDIYDQTLKDYQAMAEIATKTAAAKAKATAGPSQQGIQKFFKTPRPKADVSETKGAVQDPTVIDSESDNESDTDAVNNEPKQATIEQNMPTSDSIKIVKLEKLIETLIQRLEASSEREAKLIAMLAMFTNSGTPAIANPNTQPKQNNQQNPKNQQATNKQQPRKPKVNPQKQDDVVEIIDDQEWQPVTYARVAKRKSLATISKKAINRIARNINKERPDQPAEFSVLHIEFKNSKQIARLVKAKQFEVLSQIMKKTLDLYEIKHEVIRHARIGSNILEIYIDKKNKDTVQQKVWNNGGHFDEDFKAGDITDEARERMTPETIDYIERCIIQRATRQYFSAPTLKFKETVCVNYLGPLEPRIIESIIDKKESISPAPTGTMWKFENYRIIQVKVNTQESEDAIEIPATKPAFESEYVGDDYEMENTLTLAVELRNKKLKMNNDQAETASNQC